MRTTNDFDERNTSAVVIDQRVIGPMDATASTGMGVLAGVFFDMRTLDAHTGAIREIEPSVDIDRSIELSDLIVLGHVRIEVVLASKYGRFDRALKRSTQSHRQLDNVFVQHRQRTRKAETHRTHIGVGLIAKHVWTSAEQLGDRRKLAVNFETNNDLP